MRRLLPLSLMALFLLASAGLAGVKGKELRVENLQLQVELTPQAKCLVEASAVLRGETDNLFPLELELRVSTSGSSSVKLELGGSAEVKLPEGVEDLLSSLDLQFLNTFLSSYEGKTLGELMEGGESTGLPQLEFPEIELPEEMREMVLEKVEVKELKVLQPGVRFSLLVVLGGVERGREYLPLSLQLSLELAEGGALLSARSEFSLPHEEGRVVVNLPENLNLGGLLGETSVGNFSLVLKLPEGASVSGLPPGFENEGAIYTFSGENMELFQSLIRDLGETSISYEYSPPATSLPLLVAVAVAILVLLTGGTLWVLRGKKRGILSRGKKRK
ncbi:MAG: hypothetical protein QW084_00345 [Candidatus Hadarchaeales archaeon]